MNASAAVAGFGLGLALAGAPGPVQAILLAEGIRGGVRRAVRAMAGANLTFALLLLAVALGLSVARPSHLLLTIVRLAGGLFLLWLAAEGLLSSRRTEAQRNVRGSLPPAARGTLAVILNPGGWIFLATVATSLFAAAAQLGGRAASILTALALTAGIAVGDFGVVLLGGLGLRRVDPRVTVWVRRGLALVLAGLGGGLLLSGLLSR
ncbi:MAG: LysE family transporter [Candidatus Dormibacteraeota bacterium]|nr:LysE family transporter [Candidatus Dormibacteraeota bacterium]